MPFDDFEDNNRLMAAFDRARVSHELNLDRAGITNSGHIARVIHDDVRISPEKRQEKARFANLMFQLTLQELLEDPVYRERWEKFGSFLATYSKAAQTALERAVELAEAAREAVRSSLNDAHKLDGEAVFETHDGRYVYADGREVAPSAYDRIKRSPNANTHAEHLLLLNAETSANASVSEIKRYQSQLDETERRRRDPENHYKSPEEMDAEQKRLEEIAPQAVKQAIEAAPVQNTQRVPAGSINL